MGVAEQHEIDQNILPTINVDQEILDVNQERVQSKRFLFFNEIRILVGQTCYFELKIKNSAFNLKYFFCFAYAKSNLVRDRVG